LRVNTTGFVGFGISNDPNMIDADLFIGGFNATTDETYGKVRINQNISRLSINY